MGAASNIVINDGEATPVARTFEPARIDGNFSQFENRINGVYAGYDKVTIDLKRPTGPIVEGVNRNLKLTFRIETPMMKTASTGGTSAGYTAGPAVDYRLVAELKLTLPEQASEQDRKNLRTLLANLADHSVYSAACDSFDLPY